MPEGGGLLQEADSLGRSAHILYHLNLWHRTFAERSAVCSNVLGQVSGASMSYVRRSDDSFMKLYYTIYSTLHHFDLEFYNHEYYRRYYSGEKKFKNVSH